MRDLTISEYLDRLAERVPAPGGGAAAALHAAQAAALVAMVARYTTGEKHAAHADAVRRITAEADELRAHALRLAEEDAAAFTAVTEAYRLPRGTAEEQAVRRAAVGGALLGAARPPAALVGVAAAVLALAEELLPIGNRNLLSDLAAAADAARAAATTARINVEVNLARIDDDTARAEPAAAAARAEDVAERADRVAARVRAEITG